MKVNNLFSNFNNKILCALLLPGTWYLVMYLQDISHAWQEEFNAGFLLHRSAGFCFRLYPRIIIIRTVVVVVVAIYQLLEEMTGYILQYLLVDLFQGKLTVGCVACHFILLTPHSQIFFSRCKNTCIPSVQGEQSMRCRIQCTTDQKPFQFFFLNIT